MHKTAGCKGNRLQTNQEAKGAQRTSSNSCQQIRTKGSGHEACESVVAIHSSQHTVPERNQITQPVVTKAHESVVKEYMKLSHSFEEAKAENMSLKSSSIESSSDELEDIDSLKTKLSKLTAENDVLKNETSELKAEIEILKQVVSTWNRSSRSLHKLNESQKLANDKSGLGFNSSEFSEGETSTQSQQAYDKFNKMSFVKANVIYDCFESVKYDDQNSPKLSDNGKASIGFSKPESFKPNWLKNKLDKDKAKAGQKPLEESDNDVPQRQSAEGEQPVVVITHNNVQQDTTGNPAVIDLTNMNKPQDQCPPSAPAAGNETTNNQDAAQPEVAPAGSTYQSKSTSPAGQPAARNYQSVLGPTTGQPVACPLQLVSCPLAGESVSSTSRPPADQPVARTSYQLEADGITTATRLIHTYMVYAIGTLNHLLGHRQLGYLLDQLYDLDNTTGNKQTKPQRDMGSNPSTESK
ncbi:hypothetical protein F511_39498 [Dorcoceras hygrometricum]|uniref:Uncharacterized protein n=1 Tax=Dorcoceras hygrometricum TaxID=472368 RepID=A0A2Z7B0F5_9LAMI|nr:hypothetical protein F511_39498 [Dorcoceras hygrometricum]